MRLIRRYNFPGMLAGLTFTLLVVNLPLHGQTEITGLIDLEADTEQKIAQLYARVNADPDMKPERQAMLLHWLIDLLVSSGRLDEAGNCYRRILSYYPNDVSTLNRYGGFLLEAAADTVKAHQVLRDAIQIGRQLNIPAQVAGNSYFLLGRLNYGRGDLERAIELFESARLSFGQEPPPELLRLLALSFERLGQYDPAARTCLDLLGQERGLSPAAAGILRRVHPLSDQYARHPLDSLIVQSVQEHDARRRAELQAVGAQLVNIPGADQFTLEGTLYASAGPRGVVFVPQLGHQRTVWRAFTQLLHVDSVSSLAFDLRGHGGSRTAALPSRDQLTAGDLELFPADVDSVLDYFHRATGGRLQRRVVVAEGSACGWVEIALRQQEETTAVLYVSPLLEVNDRELAHAIAFRRDRPTLIVYSAEDVMSAAAIEYLSKSKKLDHLEIIRLSRAGHGVDMLNQDPAAAARFMAWLNKLLADPSSRPLNK